VTREGLESMLMSCLEQAGVRRLIENVSNSEDSNDERQPRQFIAHMWNGSFHAVRGTSASLAHLCFTFCKNGGLDESQECPPQNTYPQDKPNPNSRKRLSDLKFLMSSIGSRAQELECWHESPNMQQVIQMYTRVVESDDSIVSFTSTNKRKRRVDQLKWPTVVKDLRKRSRIEALEQ